MAFKARFEATKFEDYPELWNYGLAFVQRIHADRPRKLRAKALAKEVGKIYAAAASRSARKQPWKQSTGTLAKSFRYRIRNRGRYGYTTILDSATPYARIQNTGGVIKPVKAKMLSIPLTPKARSVVSPRQLTLTIRRMAGKLFLVDSNGKPQFILKHSITVPATGYLDRAIKNGARTVKRRLPMVYENQIKKYAPKGGPKR